jgi:hypothetical protein
MMKYVLAVVLGMVLMFALPAGAVDPIEDGSDFEAPTQIVEEETLSGGSLGQFSATAICPEGTILTGGGFRTSDATNAPVHSNRPDGNGWTVGAAAKTTVNHAVTAYALCATLD